MSESVVSPHHPVDAKEERRLFPRFKFLTELSQVLAKVVNQLLEISRALSTFNHVPVIAESLVLLVSLLLLRFRYVSPVHPFAANVVIRFPLRLSDVTKLSALKEVKKLLLALIVRNVGIDVPLENQLNSLLLIFRLTSGEVEYELAVNVPESLLPLISKLVIEVLPQPEK